MRFICLDCLTVTTKAGQVRTTPGQIISIDGHKAAELVSKGKIKPVMDIMKSEYAALMNWLQYYDYDNEQIRKDHRGLFLELQGTIKAMDRAMIAEDLEGFRRELLKFKTLFLQAVQLAGLPI